MLCIPVLMWIPINHLISIDQLAAPIETKEDCTYDITGNISPPSLHETSADLQGSQRLGGMERRQYHISLSSHLLSKPAGEQLERVEEILWQLEIASDYTRLCNILLIPS